MGIIFLQLVLLRAINSSHSYRELETAVTLNMSKTFPSVNHCLIILKYYILLYRAQSVTSGSINNFFTSFLIIVSFLYCELFAYRNLPVKRHNTDQYPLKRKRLFSIIYLPSGRNSNSKNSCPNLPLCPT